MNEATHDDDFGYPSTTCFGTSPVLIEDLHEGIVIAADDLKKGGYIDQDMIQLSCRIDLGEPKFEVLWFRNNEVIVMYIYSMHCCLLIS